MTDTAWLIDGSAYVFRSYYSMRPIEAPDGTPVNAVFGLGMSLQRLIRDHAPRYLAIAFDAGRKTFRNEIYPAYKANRGEPPEDLVPQFPLCPELTRAMGMVTILQKGLEADDLLATLALRLLSEGLQVMVVTQDKDFSQILRPGLRIFDLAKGIHYGHEDVPARLGVKAAQVVDLLALMGDASDNIPGVAGIGKKSATHLLEHFKDLDAIYRELDEVEILPLRGAKSWRKKLEEGKENAYLSRRLATVETALPLEINAHQLRYGGADGEKLDDFAQHWGLQRMAARVPRRR